MPADLGHRYVAEMKPPAAVEQQPAGILDRRTQRQGVARRGHRQRPRSCFLRPRYRSVRDPRRSYRRAKRRTIGEKQAAADPRRRLVLLHRFPL